MTARDVDLLQHRIDAITRAAARIRAHLADLHTLAFEATSHGDDDKIRRTKTDQSLRGGDPRARRMWDRAQVEIGRCEDTLVGLERSVTGYFLVNTTSAEPSRGSLIPAGEHTRLLAAQKARAAAGEYTPARLVDQPQHPSRGRP